MNGRTLRRLINAHKMKKITNLFIQHNIPNNLTYTIKDNFIRTNKNFKNNKKIKPGCNPNFNNNSLKIKLTNL